MTYFINISRLFEASVEKEEILHLDPVEFLGLQVKTHTMFIRAAKSKSQTNLGSTDPKGF